MKNSTLKIAFLSTDGLEDRVIDDDLALEPLRALNAHAQRVSWRDENAVWSDFDLVIVRSTWDYQHHDREFFEMLEVIERSGTRLVNPLDVMRWNHRKTYLRDLQDLNIPIVDTRFGDALDAVGLDELVAQFGHGEWIIKPDVGASAGGVVRLDGVPDNDTRQALLAQFESTGFLAQPFVESVTSNGEYSVFYFDGVFSHCILKSPKDGDFRVQEEHGGHIRAVDLPVAIGDAAQKVYDALPARCLYVRVDLVANQSDGYEVMEVELIEPSLYLRTHPAAPANFARAICQWHDRHEAQSAN